MSGLEDLGRPSHGYGDCGTKTKSDDQETSVARPRIRSAASVGGYKETSDLDEDGDTKEEGAMMVEAVRDWCHKKNGDEVHLRC